MPRTPSILREMADALTVDLRDEPRPTEEFTQSALPGFKQTLIARRSIRVFDGVSIPEAVMRDCLRDAVLAPSSSNLQPYELYWVRNAAKKERLAEACLGQPAATTAGDLVVVVARGDLWKVNLDKLVAKMTTAGAGPLPAALDEYYNIITPRILQTDPFGIYNLVRRVYYWFSGRNQPSLRTPVNRGDHRVYANIQAALAAETLLLSLAAHGYESCPMGGIDALRIRQLLDLPSTAEITMVIGAGRGKPEGLYGPRLRLSEEDLIKEI